MGSANCQKMVFNTTSLLLGMESRYCSNYIVVYNSSNSAFLSGFVEEK